jgi:hypothetical protein
MRIAAFVRDRAIMPRGVYECAVNACGGAVPCAPTLARALVLWQNK